MHPFSPQIFSHPGWNQTKRNIVFLFLYSIFPEVVMLGQRVHIFLTGSQTAFPQIQAIHIFSTRKGWESSFISVLTISRVLFSFESWKWMEHYVIYLLDSRSYSYVNCLLISLPISLWAAWIFLINIQLLVYRDTKHRSIICITNIVCIWYSTC